MVTLKFKLFALLLNVYIGFHNKVGKKPCC